ncbi:MAG: PilT/PilU family type 4a pilus ATPase [Acidimicrobiia bacterium]|nr:PilT/PilU family type 4a pilus ATPase [Acidimicrobiia bacterium]
MTQYEYPNARQEAPGGAVADSAWTRPAGYRPASRLGALPAGYERLLFDDGARQDPRAAAPPPQTAPIGQGTVEHLLAALVQYNGSDLLVSVGTPPRIRIDGALRVLREEPVTVEESSAYVRELLDDERVAVLQQYRSVDFAFTGVGGARFRGNIYYSKGAFSIALRHLPGVIPTPEALGIPPAVVRMAERPSGLILVTGPTGSGKSTTIASLLERINLTRACHVVTIEDPIEFRFQHKMAMIDQREIGWDALTFADGLRSVLREDPDVVLVGEMRDLDSTSSTITVAETGHLVFGTLHTNDAPSAVDRVIDVFPPEQQLQIRTQLAAALVGVVHQRLYPLPEGGRVAAFEVLVATEAVRRMIREGRTEQLRSVMTTDVTEGMMTLDRSLAHLGLLQDPNVAPAGVDLDLAHPHPGGNGTHT